MLEETKQRQRLQQEARTIANVGKLGSAARVEERENKLEINK